MQPVIHASLHGNAFVIEEAGYLALRAYLDRAAAQLSADPDRDEILGDLEQAIADKCARHLGPHKSVVTAAEMAQVLAEMGPVGTPAEVGPDAPAAPRAAPAAGERRLYRVLEGGKLAGLCNGLGAYFGLDANLVRAIFVVLALLTHGAWLLVYLVLVFVVPAAGTPEERAAARGLPFSAQALVDEAKRHYATLEQELQGPWARWRASWSSGTREARRQAREAASAARGAWQDQRATWGAAAPTAPPAGPPPIPPPHSSSVPPPIPPTAPPPSWPAPPPVPPAPPPARYARQVAAALMVPVVAFWGSALLVAEGVCAALLIANGRILGWSPGLPLWGSLVILMLLGALLRRPIAAAGAALRRAPATPLSWLPVWEAAFWIGFVALFGSLAWTFTPELRSLAHDLPGAWAKVLASWHASH